ncbi:O-antigen ligase family protein [Grimontia hollisae]|uniref:O-antigen ligase family protein n=1 Tax=Grimontia hollisae TaxID=673 RepID=UPI00165E2F78|nr:O-antigen ligase family protein [Grimontia hollisae]
MSAITFQNIIPFNKQRLEALFLLSPLAVLFLGIFNIAETKSILSRLIPLVCVYCLWFYRDALKQNWQAARTRPLMITSLVAFFYFGFLHLLRGDEFDFSRTLVTCLIYLLMLPWAQLPRHYLTRMLIFAAILCGLNAMYEFWGLGIQRVGVATNPIPYALFCAFMVLSALHQCLMAKSWPWRIVSGLGVALAGTAIVLTDVRGVILFLPVVMVYMVLRIVQPSFRTYLAALLAVALLCGLGYKAFEDKIKQRIAVTEYEFTQIANGNFNTSIGIRLTLWLQGKEIVSQAPIFGVGDDALREDISARFNRGDSNPPHLHNQYFDTLARYGVLGLMVLLAWFVSPLLYVTSSASHGRVGFSLDPLLSSLMLMVALAGLTDVPFHHTHLVYLFTLFTGAWLFMPSEAGNETASVR